MKISIVIPFFNTKLKYVHQLLDLIETSDCYNLEFVFVDDGSNFDVSNLVKTFCNHNGYKFYRFDSNFGVSNARNKGIEIASNDFIMFLDSDDLINFSFLNNNDWNENVDLIMFRDDIFFDRIKIPLNQEPVKLKTISNDISTLYFNNNDRLNLRSACCKILRKELIEKYKLYFDLDLPFYEDAFFMTAYYNHVFAFEAYSNVLYYYRIYNSSSSKKHNSNYIKKYSLFFYKYLEKFGNNENFVHALYLDTFRSVLINKFTRSIKSLHIIFAYRLLKSDFLRTSSEYIVTNFPKTSFEFKVSSKLLSEKYLLAFWAVLLHRFTLSIRIKLKKFFKGSKRD